MSQQEIELPQGGIELTTLSTTGLEVWCLSNSANLPCLASLRLSDTDKDLEIIQVQKVKWCIKQNSV